MKRILKMLRGNRFSRQRPQGLGTPMFERLEPRLLLNAVPYMQDFNLGKPGGAEGWEYYSDNEGRIEVVGGWLRMDDKLGNETYSQNEAILHVDLTGRTNVMLTLDHTSIYDEVHTLPTSFVGRYKGDGISLSVDGQHWVKVTDLT
ncbi:MAG: LEPR-XLL domain-containing protein, partial [Phycisphaerae bacterium]